MTILASAIVPRTGLRHELRVLFRVTLNQLLVETRYRNKFAIDLTAHVLYMLPLALTAWAFSDGRNSARLEELTGLPDQFTFVVLGIVAFTALGTGNFLMQDTHVAGGIAYEMITGTLERLFVTPARRITLVLGISVYYLSIFTFQSVTLFVGAAVIFGFRPEITSSGLAWAAFAFVAMIAVNLALGVIGAALTLAYKDPQLNLLIFHRPMAIVSGAYFLIDLAPQPFRTISLFNPMAYCIDGFRGALTGKTLLMSSLEAEMAVIAAIVVGFGVISTLIYRRMLDRLGATGNISIF